MWRSRLPSIKLVILLIKSFTWGGKVMWNSQRKEARRAKCSLSVSALISWHVTSHNVLPLLIFNVYQISLFLNKITKSCTCKGVYASIYCERDRNTPFTLTPSCVIGLWEETGEPGGNHRKTQTPDGWVKPITFVLCRWPETRSK